MANLKAVVDTTGSNAASKVLLDLLNRFPGLNGSVITFAALDETSGISFNPTSGAAYLENRESITGHVRQTCQYPFVIIYRAAAKTEAQKIRIKEFLDLLGRWLEMQPVTIGGNEYQLSEYPDLGAGNRKITTIVTTNAAHCQAAYQDGVEDWSLSMAMRYRNEYTKGE